jgi:hypothetical protein
VSDLTELERELLVEGLGDYVGLWEFASWLRTHEPSATDEEVRRKATEAVRRLVVGGHMSPGALTDGGGFSPWTSDAGESLQRIDREWRALGRDPTIAEICWFSNTPSGDALARELL